MKQKDQPPSKPFSLYEEIPVKLAHWEGPLELLLSLIHSAQLSLYDIPIHRITKDYLNALALMQQCNLSVTSDFIALASELVLLKSRLLLPEELQEETILEADPRLELVEKLLEYQKFKKAAQAMEKSWSQRTAVLEKKIGVGEKTLKKSLVGTLLAPQPSSRLSSAWEQVNTTEFIEVIKQIAGVLTYRPYLERGAGKIVKLEEKKQSVLKALLETPRLEIKALLKKNETVPRIELAVTFWALLELFFRRKITLEQATAFAPLYASLSPKQ